MNENFSQLLESVGTTPLCNLSDLENLYCHLIGTALKDISIMITLTPSVSPSAHQYIQHTIKIIDLDVKSIDSICHNYEVDNRIIDTKFGFECT